MKETIDQQIALLNRSKGEIDSLIENGVRALENLNSMIQGAVDGTEKLRTELEGKRKELESLKTNLATLEQEKNALETQLASAEPLIKELEEKSSAQKSEIEELKGKITELTSKTEEKKKSIDVAQKEKKMKEDAYESLTRSINEDVDKAKARLEQVQEEAKKIPEENLGMNYLLSRGLEGPSAPKAEILTIIAAEHPISTDDIKKKVTSISPVQVSRFITMLEADGMIMNEENLWTLDKELLEKLKL